MSGAIVHEEVHRELGKHDGLIQGLQHRVEKIDVNVEKILEHINQTKGGWKVLVVMSSLAGACGALVSKFISVLWYLPK
jgi:hypothetical protein